MNQKCSSRTKETMLVFENKIYVIGEELCLIEEK